VNATSTYGSTVSFTTSPSSGFSYYGAKVTNSSGGVVATLSSSQKSFTMPASAVTIKPKWKKNDFAIVDLDKGSDVLSSWPNFTKRDECCGTMKMNPVPSRHYLTIYLEQHTIARQQWTNGGNYDLTHYQTARFIWNECHGDSPNVHVKVWGAFLSTSATGATPWAHEMSPRVESVSGEDQVKITMNLNIGNLSGYYHPWFEVLVNPAQTTIVDLNNLILIGKVYE